MSRPLTPSQRRWADHAITQRAPATVAAVSWWATPEVQRSHVAFAAAAAVERERITTSVTARKSWPIDRSELDG